MLEQINFNKYLITVAIPTYNRKEYLKECIDNVISQKNKDIQILVCDNNSTDGTYEFMKEYQRKYPYIVYLRNENNIGPDGNFLRCLTESEGEYIHLLSDDDILLPNSINAIKELIKQNHPISFIHLNLTGFEGQYKSDLKITPRYKIDKDLVFEDKNKFLEYIGIYATFNSAMIFNRSIIQSILNPKQYIGTNLLQTHLAFLSLKEFNKSAVVSHVCIAARSGNSGGYNLYKVFAREWKKALYDTGLKSGFSKDVLDNIFIDTIKHFLRYWVVYFKINKTNYDSSGTKILFDETKSYIQSWIYLYPFIVIPSFLYRLLKKLKDLLRDIIKGES